VQRFVQTLRSANCVPWRVSVTFFSKNRPAGCSAKQKALVQMNIELSEVLTDVMGLSGQLIIRDIVAGERDPKALARHRHSRVKASAQERSPKR